MRPLVPEDAPRIAELELELFPDNCLNERSLAIEIEAGYGVAKSHKGTIVGYSLGRFDAADSLFDILRVGVTEWAQHRGVARAMLRRLIQDVDSDIMLTVAKRNVYALRLYQASGFRIIGQTGEDNWAMRRSHMDMLP